MLVESRLSSASSADSFQLQQFCLIRKRLKNPNMNYAVDHLLMLNDLIIF